MTHELQFPDEFYLGTEDHPKPSQRPTSIKQALLSMAEEDWVAMVKDIFPDEDPRFVDTHKVLTRVFQTNTCSTAEFPVEVWIDEQGTWRVLVYRAPSSST